VTPVEPGSRYRPIVGDMRVAAIVLAAGAGRRFGPSDKLLAPLRGQPILQHVLDTIADARLAPVIVVLGHGADRLENAIRWRAEVRVVNPDPDRGLSSSVQVGIAAMRDLEPQVDGVVIALGDQPTLSPDVVRALLGHPREGQSVIVPRYDAGGGSNPVLLLRDAWPLVDGITGDRGLGPLIAARPELVAEVPVDGSNPDVDTPTDLADLAGQSSSG
jgi:molybdenum cofactor cytidylyltransferase